MTFWIWTVAILIGIDALSQLWFASRGVHVRTPAMLMVAAAFNFSFLIWLAAVWK